MAIGSADQHPQPAALTAAPDGRSPLHLVSNVAEAEDLIRCGADPQQRDAFGMSPLHLAAARNDLEICRLLLKRDPSLALAIDNIGNTPLHWATRSIDIVRLLLQYNTPADACNNMGETAAMRACAQGKCDVVALLLPRIFDINAADEKGKTMLMTASQYGFKDIVDLLLERGVNPNCQDLAGWTALHFASLGAWPQHESHPRLMRSLLMHGADPNIPEASCHWRPVHVATDASAVRVLHEFGADLNAVDSDGRTPAHYLNSEGVAELRRCGAQLDAADRYGRTPLHNVASEEKAVVLAAFGANVNAVDQQGKTPLDWAVHRPPVAEALLVMGAKPGSDLNRQHYCMSYKQ